MGGGGGGHSPCKVGEQGAGQARGGSGGWGSGALRLCKLREVECQLKQGGCEGSRGSGQAR